MAAAPHSAELEITNEELRNPPTKVPKLAADWHWAAWVTRIGTKIRSDETLNKLEPLGNAIQLLVHWDTRGMQPPGPFAYEAKALDIVKEFKSRGALSADNQTDPAQSRFVSETGEITIDAPNDRMVLDTPRTAGGYSKAGTSFATKNTGFAVSLRDSDATVWVSAIDNEPIAKSKRLIFTHLTDCQNTNIKYAERARKTLLDWGKMPHLIRNGKADVKLTLDHPEKFEVWSLMTSGKRAGQVPAKVENKRAPNSRPTSAQTPMKARE